MAALESLTISFFNSSYSLNPPLQSPSRSNLSFPISTTKLSHKSYPYLLPISRNLHEFSCSAAAVQEQVSAEQIENLEIVQKRLFVLNLPWSFSADELKNLFSECGTVEDAEIIKRKKDGKSRGYAFVTMSSTEEALAVIEKYDCYELMGRIIRVEFAKDIKKSSPPPSPTGEKRCKLYVSNLAWRVRSNNLKEFFGADFNPVSTRVVFESPEGRSAGYGFVTFASKEEAESALSALNGKELLGRPITLAFSERNADKSETEDDNTYNEQPAEP
ncbi:28 kDa ribonucleoprotein, chloroplastic-like [Rutidosis leptorrhynchoides]|uniref:28 kDa ribonucleoprotein, chloroplastic-like n=1 Tax=Rutidosis leptorrhynchoides TaxID=125765 RepID=UPI003A993329